MKVSFVIPNYNGEALLSVNMPSVVIAGNVFAEKTGNTYEIIVVDDGSTDNSVQVLTELKTSYEKQNISFHFFVHPHNKGFSSTVNKGVSEAEGDFVVLLNTDVQPEKEFLLPLLQHFENESVFAVGCMDKSIESGKTVLRGRGTGRFQKGFLLHSAGVLDQTKTLWASGGSSMFRRSIWEKLGGMDQLFNPFYWEDIDLSYRAWKSGYEVHFEKDSIVLHEHDKGSIRTHQKKVRVTTTAYRNQYIFFWKNITDVEPFIQHVCWVPYHLIISLIRGNTSMVLGFLQAIQKIRMIRQSRRKAKKLFVRTDRAVLQEVER